MDNGRVAGCEVMLTKNYSYRQKTTCMQYADGKIQLCLQGMMQGPFNQYGVAMDARHVDSNSSGPMAGCRKHRCGRLSLSRLPESGSTLFWQPGPPVVRDTLVVRWTEELGSSGTQGGELASAVELNFP